MWAREATDSGCWHSHLRGAEARVVAERRGKSAAVISFIRNGVNRGGGSDDAQSAAAAPSAPTLGTFAYLHV